MNQIESQQVDVLVIGAGPSGSLASSLLVKQGIKTLVVEQQQFPRFSIGESLLPHLMECLQNAELEEVVKQAGFQLKNGAAFRKCGGYSSFNFTEKFSAGPGTTFQVKRAEFDKALADAAEGFGVSIRYRHQVVAIETNEDCNLVTIVDLNDNSEYQVQAGFVLDASGFGRVLPRLLQLETPSEMPMRESIFCHIKDGILDPDYDRNKILVSVHPQNRNVWYWLIPFSDGTASVGVVAFPEFFEQLDGCAETKLHACIAAETDLAHLLKNATITTEVRQIKGYSANVKSLYGQNYALLGNAGEFLDPIFSSGVTIAFKSAEMAANLLIKQKRGQDVCWQKDYAVPLQRGVDTFREFVNAWYDGRLQDIIFFTQSSSDVRKMICSILAGYAWDEDNPYVADPKRRLNVLAEICKG